MRTNPIITSVKHLHTISQRPATLQRGKRTGSEASRTHDPRVFHLRSFTRTGRTARKIEDTQIVSSHAGRGGCPRSPQMKLGRGLRHLEAKTERASSGPRSLTSEGAPKRVSLSRTPSSTPSDVSSVSGELTNTVVVPPPQRGPRGRRRSEKGRHFRTRFSSLPSRLREDGWCTRRVLSTRTERNLPEQ